MIRLLAKIRRAFWAAFEHDVLGTAKAAAYSAIFCLFPTLLVVSALLALAPAPLSLRGELRTFSQLLPAETVSLMRTVFNAKTVRSTQVILSSGLIAFWAAMGFLLSLMDGFRRAYELPREEWSFWVEHLVAVALIPSCLVPLGLATILVAFGHQIELWIVTNIGHVLGTYVLLAWRITRWTIGLLTTICLLAVIYHFGTPRRQAWKHVIPGASCAACMWFLSTLLYGFYVTRFSNYSLVYGSVATVIATLVWLYIASLSMLAGAEFNAQFYPKPPHPRSRQTLREEEKLAAAPPAHSA